MQHNNIPSEVRSHHLCHILLIKPWPRAIPHSRGSITLGTNYQKAQITGVYHRICTPYRCTSIFSCVKWEWYWPLPCHIVCVYLHKELQECLTHIKCLINVRYCFHWVFFFTIFLLCAVSYTLLASYWFYTHIRVKKVSSILRYGNLSCLV